MDDRVVIALFRHGITEENKRRAYLGWKDSPLCEEAKELSTSKSYESYFSSDLSRCVTTTNLLFPNSEPSLLKEIREMNFGVWEGKTYYELKDNPHYCQWLTAPEHHRPPEGESFHEFSERVQAGWNKMITEVLCKQLKSCAVITHGGVIRNLLTKYAPEQKEFWSWQTSHIQGFELIFQRDGLRRGERCTLLQEVPLTEKGSGS